MSRTDKILGRLLALHPNKLIDLKLNRIERLLQALGNPEQKLPPTIHVAGTNGKGSTIAHLRSFLEAGGKKVHVYNSPHLVRFNERIRLAGKLVSSRRLNRALQRCEDINASQPITYFEITTAAAFLLFAEVKADYLLLEVGLGGRFDATNVIEHPRGTILTPISIDHVEFLGDDLAGIAREKSGILKRNSPCVVGQQPTIVDEEIEHQAQKLGVKPKFADQDFQGFAENGRMTYQDENGLLDLPLSNLAGPFQIQNAALAIAAVRQFDLPVAEEQIITGLGNVDWPGRLMPIKSGTLFDHLIPGQQLWLDGGHNIAGGKVLADALHQMASEDNRPLVLVLGAYANKDMAGYLANFLPLEPKILTVPLKDQRASWEPIGLASLANSSGFNATPMKNILQAMTQATQTPNARIIICGSLHLVGDALLLNKTLPQ